MDGSPDFVRVGRRSHAFVASGYFRLSRHKVAPQTICYDQYVRTQELQIDYPVPASRAHRGEGARKLQLCEPLDLGVGVPPLHTPRWPNNATAQKASFHLDPIMWDTAARLSGISSGPIRIGVARRRLQRIPASEVILLNIGARNQMRCAHFNDSRNEQAGGFAWATFPEHTSRGPG